MSDIIKEAAMIVAADEHTSVKFILETMKPERILHRVREIRCRREAQMDSVRESWNFGCRRCP